MLKMRKNEIEQKENPFDTKRRSRSELGSFPSLVVGLECGYGLAWDADLGAPGQRWACVAGQGLGFRV